MTDQAADDLTAAGAVATVTGADAAIIGADSAAMGRPDPEIMMENQRVRVKSRAAVAVALDFYSEIRKLAPVFKHKDRVTWQKSHQ